MARPNQQQINLGANSSFQTGNPWYVGEALYVTVSVTTGAAAASRVTIVGSNLDGFQSGLSTALATVSNNTWSQVTAITGQGLFVIDPGFRWVNAIRDTSASGQTASNITVVFNQAF